MAAGIGQKIEATDYNSIQNKIAGILGTGSGTSGYGQTPSSASVIAGSTVNLSGWLNLRADLRAAREHQLGTGTVSTGSATDGVNLLVPATSLVITEALRNQYNLFADTVILNKFLLGSPGQFSAETVITFSKTGSWNGTIANVVTVSGSASGAGTAENTRYFFNAGGSFQIESKRLGTSTEPKDTIWTNMLTQAGVVSMNNTTTTYSGINGTVYSVGYNSLTTTNQVIFWKPAPVGNYAENNYFIYAKKSANGADVIFTIEFRDNDVGDPSFDENVNLAPGTSMETIVSMKRPSGSNVSVLAPTSSQTGM
jgi:hypothetical protein